MEASIKVNLIPFLQIDWQFKYMIYLFYLFVRGTQVKMMQDITSSSVTQPISTAHLRAKLLLECPPRTEVWYGLGCLLLRCREVLQ